MNKTNKTFERNISYKTTKTKKEGKTMITTKQAEEIVKKNQIEKEKRTAYNKKRWQSKKNELAEAMKVLEAAKKIS